jgi:peptidoglycan/LPS O-acetylase OafA/YrhL
MSDSKTEVRDSNCFDFLRLVAAVCVVIGHSVAHLQVPFFWLNPGGHLWFYDGVPLFFILSGMLVYRSCEKCVKSGRPIWHFYLNRFLRIAPAIYAYVVVITAILLTVGVVNQHALLTRGFLVWFVGSFALVPIYNPIIFRHFGVGVLNGSLWTIPTEVGFYILVPAIFLLEQRRGFHAMSRWLIACALIGLALEWGIRSVAPAGLAAKLYNVSFGPHLLFFALGIIWSRAWRFVPKQIGWMLLCTACYGIAKWFARDVQTGPLYKLVWALPLSYMVLWIGYWRPGPLNKITRIGDLSYGVYIWHMVIVNLFIFLKVPQRVPALSGTATHLLVLFSSFCVALVSWHLIEKPALRLKPFTTRRASPELSHATPRDPVRA